MIVLVERENQCLLASSPRFKGDFYSVLAGFAEPGETLEETVAREVYEETGIEVTDIRYFGSQPWPFPDSLMIGFTARYAGGEIRVDGEEILDARWFTRRPIAQHSRQDQHRPAAHRLVCGQAPNGTGRLNLQGVKDIAEQAKAVLQEMN